MNKKLFLICALFLIQGCGGSSPSKISDDLKEKRNSTLDPSAYHPIDKFLFCYDGCKGKMIEVTKNYSEQDKTLFFDCHQKPSQNVYSSKYHFQGAGDKDEDFTSPTYKYFFEYKNNKCFMKNQDGAHENFLGTVGIIGKAKIFLEVDE